MIRKSFLRRRRRPSGLGDAAASLADLAAAAGFTGSDLRVAVAIALAESGGNPNAVGDRTRGVSIGLWQINQKAHPEFAGWNLYDPQTNANAAFRVYNVAGGFSPWTTYKTGAYLAYLPASSPGPSDSAPVTIDASTGTVIPDAAPTPGLALNVPPLVWIGGAAVAAYAFADYFFGD